MTNSNINLPELRAFFYKYLENPFAQTLLPRFRQTGYGNNLDEERIIRQFRPVIEEQVRQFVSSWSQTYRQQMGDFITILEKLASRFNELEQDQASASLVWQELDLALKAIEAWLESSLPAISSPNLWADFRNQFSENLETLPEFAHVQVPADYWAIKPDDSAGMRVWKKKKQVKIGFRNSIFSLRNQLRRLIRRAPLKPVPLQRKFHLHSFLIYFLELPTAHFLMTEWQQFVQQIANQLYELHQRTIEIKDDFLFLTNFETAILKFDPAELDVKSERLQKHIQTTTFLHQQIDQFESESMQRFQIFEADVYEKLWQHWHVAGTYGLADANFDQRQIAKSWKRVKAQLAQTRESWAGHFEGEQGEWRTDIELSLLQLRAAQICHHLLHNVEQKINGRVIPAFDTTHETVAAFLEEFQAMETGDMAGLRDEVTKQNRAIIQFLQRDRLPLLMDTLINVQLDKVINGWGAGVSNAMELLSNEHIIFRQRDLNSPVPNSKIAHIPNLKKVALEDLSSKYQTRYHTFTLEIQQSLENIIRGISEIDQIIELNLKATLIPLTQRHGAAVVAEARHTIIEGLHGTSAQLGQLTTQAEELLTLSTRYLLQITVDLENQLEVLGDTEKIAEVSLRLPSIKTGEKLRIRCRKFFSAFKTGPQSLFQTSTGLLLQFQHNYFRLREMTGLAPEKADAEENLSQFLTDTEKHISALPYMYQRLFRLEPLTDEQFFTYKSRHTFQRYSAAPSSH